MITKFLHYSYCKLHSARQWRHHHLNPAGMMLLTALIISLIFGVHVTETSIYRFTALCGSALAVNLITTLIPFRPRLTIQRILPEYITAGTTAFYELEITNHSDKTEQGLFLHEVIADPRPSTHTLESRPEPFEHLRNRWDRKTLYYRWTWLVHKKSKASFKRLSLPPIPPGQTIRLKAPCKAHHRGYLHFTGHALLKPDIMGLFNRCVMLPVTDKLLILPKQVTVAPPELSNSRHYQPGGINLASSIGNSEEFISLRPYRPGDPLRNIHWRSYAKTGELIIREYEDEFYVRHALILDTSVANNNELAFEEAVSVGASLIQTMEANDSIIDLIFVGDKIYSFSSGRGLAPLDKMMEVLACVEAEQDQPLEDLVQVLEDNISRFSGIICLFLGWSDAHRDIRTILKRAAVPAWILILTGEELKTREKVIQEIGELEDITIRVVKTRERI